MTWGAVNTGSPDVPNLGEITFYPHKITQIQMQEILYAGFTFEAIAEGKVPYTPQQEMSDIVATKNDQSFSDAQAERAAVAKEVSFVLRPSATPHLKPPAPHQSCQHDLSSHQHQHRLLTDDRNIFGPH